MKSEEMNPIVYLGIHSREQSDKDKTFSIAGKGKNSISDPGNEEIEEILSS